jgi:hypothetical protein
VQALYNATHIQVQLKRAITGIVIADFTARGRNNDLSAWHNKDIGLYSSGNRNGVLYHSWVLTNGGNVVSARGTMICVAQPVLTLVIG